MELFFAKRELRISQNHSVIVMKVSFKLFSESTLYSTTKFSEESKFKELADVKINLTQKFKFVFEWVENILGKGENAGYQHFLLFPKCF